MGSWKFAAAVPVAEGRRALGLLLGLFWAAGLVCAAWGDVTLDDLKKRKADLEQMAADCAAMPDTLQKANCLAARQKKVDLYKVDLAAYKANLNKNAAKSEDLDYQSAIADREKSIKEFTDYYSTCTDKNARCASALYQAATLTYQKEEFVFLAAEAIYEKDYQSWEDHDHEGVEPTAPNRNHNESLQLFQRFLKDYPDDPQVPDALAGASFVADMQGNSDLSYEYLNKLVTGWPDNPLAVKAHLRLGEYWLLKHEYQKAIDQYVLVPVDFPGNEAGLALYHRAESYYDLTNYQEAAHWYYEYIVRADAGKIQGDLRDEALSFLAACWAEMDHGVDSASAFLGQHGHPAWEMDVYYQMGMKNKIHDRLDEALSAFQYLLTKDPTYPKAPSADLGIVEILTLQKKAEDAQNARVALAQRYTENSEWYRANAGDKAAVADADATVHRAMYEIPVYYHQKSEAGDSDRTLLPKAEAGYRDYLNRFPNEASWNVYQVHQHLAVLYAKLLEYSNSAGEWRWCATADTVKMGKIPADVKNLVSKQDAGYNAVLMMDAARVAALRDVYHNDTAAAYAGPETKAYLDYVGWFTQMYANSPVIADIAYNAAILDYEAKQYDAAVRSLSGLIAKFPNHPRAVLIRRALAQSLLVGGHYSEAAKQFLILQSKLCPFDSQCAEIKASVASALFKQAEAQENGRDFSSASEQFQQLVRDYRDVDIADKALFEAGVSMDSAGNHDEGARLLLRIPQDYPNSTLRVKAMLKAADIYTNEKKYLDAADVFLKLESDFPTDSLGGIQALAWAADAYQKAQSERQAGQTYESAYRLYPTDTKTPGYLYNAGQIYESAKWYGDAIDAYQLVYQNYPSSEFAPDAMFSVPLLLDKQSETEKAAQAYDDFVAKYPNDKAKVMQAELNAGKNYESLGDEKEALEHYAKCTALQPGSGLPPAIASEAAYRAGDIYYQKVAVIRLDGTKSENDGRIKGMQENLIPAIQYYAKAVQFAEEEWALRATLRMGDLFSTIALISDNQRVAGLSGDDRFRVSISAKASVPDYLDKAAGIYQKNLEIGLSQNIESPWIDTAGTRLMETYVFKGRALEDLAQLFLEVPLPEGGTPEDIAQAKDQLKKASDEQLSKAMDTYREALKLAQTYYLDNPARSQIIGRLRALDPNSPELELQVPQKPKASTDPDSKTDPDAKPASVPETQGHSKG